MKVSQTVNQTQALHPAATVLQTKNHLTAHQVAIHQVATHQIVVVNRLDRPKITMLCNQLKTILERCLFQEAV